MTELVARSEAMREVVRLAERVATTDANVLVTGESGAGKEAVSRFIHSRSRRARAPFVKIDCAALPAELLEAELFGYERGAFTGATTTAGALAMLEGYEFPGNVRELAHVLERAVIVADGEEIGAEHLPEPLRAASALKGRRGNRMTLAELEEQYINETLAAARGNKSEAARLLGISRKNLYEKLARYKNDE
ncbi:MAG: sigma 54-interacting transcriptional regulator [Acidobacteria bacterium]|nr:sigma 54-interacting transcriptional regulator [Acidobacteriota bacterium]